MAESDLHRAMKRIVRSALEAEGYRLVEEPLYPPTRRVSWSSYRPDLLGIRRDGAKEELVVVECETRPSRRRFRAKNYSSLWFQASVTHEGSIRRVLAVPRGRLHGVDLRLRDSWEVWILGRSEPLERYGTLRNVATASASAPESAEVALGAPRAMGSPLPPIRAGTSRR